MNNKWKEINSINDLELDTYYIANINTKVFGLYAKLRNRLVIVDSVKESNKPIIT